MSNGDSDPETHPVFSNETHGTSAPVQWDQLEKMILNYYENVKLTKEEYLEAVTFTQNLEEEIRKTMPGARLEIGGSLCNGFGTHDSDLDFCFRLGDNNRPKGFNELKTLTDLSEILAGMGINNKIIKSRINIIKCDNNNSVNRSMDIFCYNTLALHNTKLLAKYCEWEPKRLPALGVWVKKWAKTCNIGDASDGTLSSYAWMIILIHYLQNCIPPVLPRLQEDFRTNATEPTLHMECNVYFHFQTVHENWSLNTQSVAELFADFLTYIRFFDFKNLITQIRQKAEVNKWEKGWGRSRICVEDPFLLSRNLTERKEKNVITLIWKTVFHSEKAFRMAEEHPNWVPRAEYLGRQRLKLLNNQLVKRVTICPLCEMLGPCKDGCENRYERHPNWVSNSERAERRRLKKELKEKARILIENNPQPTKRHEINKNNNRRQVNQITGQFSNLMISQQNLAPHLQYPFCFPLMAPPTQAYYYPPPLGLHWGSFTYPPPTFSPLVPNGNQPQQKNALFHPTATQVPKVPEPPMDSQKLFTGNWSTAISPADTP